MPQIKIGLKEPDLYPRYVDAGSINGKAFLFIKSLIENIEILKAKSLSLIILEKVTSKTNINIKARDVFILNDIVSEGKVSITAKRIFTLGANISGKKGRSIDAEECDVRLPWVLDDDRRQLITQFKHCFQYKTIENFNTTLVEMAHIIQKLRKCCLPSTCPVSTKQAYKFLEIPTKRIKV